jgi:hypothetical protein
MTNLQTSLKEFLHQHDPTDFYNESTMQLELAIFLRKSFPNYRIHLERPLNHFGSCRTSHHDKKEIDICVLSEELQQGWLKPERKPKLENTFASAVEIKFPKPGNGRVPETCFDFCKDIRFAEQMRSSGFDQAFAVLLTNNNLYWQGRETDGIYSFFRNKDSLHGQVFKPTGTGNTFIHLSGTYQLEWHDVANGYRYLLVKAQ